METPTQQFIQDAIAGGYENNYAEANIGRLHMLELTVARILLDPLVWQAVGKTRGWRTTLPCGLWELTGSSYVAGYEGLYRKRSVIEWQYRRDLFIDALDDGKTIDDALAAITNT